MSSVADSLARPAVAARRTTSPGSTAMIAAAIVLTGAYLAATIGPRQAALFAVGIGAGLVLYHAAFGFTSSWRIFIADGRGAGLRAQMLMLAVTCLVFFPLLASGQFLGQPLRGSISPAGVGVLVGAFMFGVGMQLGGGCASGTLYSAGGGNTRMMVTLLSFVLGSVIGTAHVQWWASLPAFAPVSIVTAWGPMAALAVSLLGFGAVWVVTTIVEQKRHGRVQALTEAKGDGLQRWMRGPWPLVAGAIGLAVVNIATLTIAGRPWGVTSAFALWGAKVFDAVGIDVASWPYWSTPAQTAALRTSVLRDVTTVMDIGIILGALLAAILANKFAPQWKTSTRSLVAALVGGLLLGYGARIAYGCNIGAYFSGIASGSAHGWLWLVAAFAGNAVAVPLRPYCDLTVEKTRG